MTTQSSEPPARRSIVPSLVFTVVAIIVVLCLHFQSPNNPGQDALYHLGHAQIYREHGPLYREFPYVQFSVISALRSDLWYGFHIYLLPFTLFPDPLMGFKAASAFGTFVLLLSLYGAFRVLDIRGAEWWPFVAVCLVPSETWRYMMLRPQQLSLGLSVLLLACVIRRKPWQILAISFAIAWFHTTTFWMAPIVAGFTVLVQFALNRRLWLAGIGATLLGSVVGVLLRPGPIEGLRLLYLQLVEWSRLKGAGVPLSVGGELQPQPMLELILLTGPLLVLWLGAIFAALYLAARIRPKLPVDLTVALVVSGILSLGFYLLSTLVARRSNDQWTLFGVFFAAACATAWPRFPVWLSRLGAALVPILVLWSIQQVNLAFRRAPHPERIRPIAEWLAQRSQPGEIVYHVDWSIFPDLFFWDRTNYFIGGMDPVFQYAYNPSLYWKTFYFERNVAGAYTSGDPPIQNAATPTLNADTYEVLRNDFRATYVVVIKPVDKSLYDYIRTDPRFLLEIERGDVAVYRLLPASGP